MRDAPGLKKKPSTSEFLDWLRLLVAEQISSAEIDAQTASSIPMLAGALLKNEQDLQLVERLMMASRAGIRIDSRLTISTCIRCSSMDLLSQGA